MFEFTKIFGFNSIKNPLNNPKKLDMEESSRILSGMLLNHCILYGALEETQEISRIQPKPTESAFIIFKFKPNGSTQSLIQFNGLTKFFMPSTVKPSSVDDDTITWLHITNLAVLPQIIMAYNLPSNLGSYFIDSSPYSRHLKLEFADFLELLTVNLQDDIINMKKLNIYCTNKLIITFEQRSHMFTDSSVSPNNSDSFATHLNFSVPGGLSRGTSITIGSELNYSPESDNGGISKYSGVLLDIMMERIKTEEVSLFFYVHFVYLIFETYNLQSFFSNTKYPSKHKLIHY